MKRIIHIGVTAMIIAVSLFGATGCVKNSEETHKKGQETTPPIFDFSTEKMATLNVSYDVPVGYKVYFEVYSENPEVVGADRQIKMKEGLKPIDKGFTDEKGQYSQKIKLSAATKQLYIYSPYFGVPRVMVSQVNGNVISRAVEPEFEMPLMMSSRAANYTTIEQGFDIRSILGSWANGGTKRIDGYNYALYGRPDYVLGEKLPISADVYNIISQELPENRVNTNHKRANDINVVEECSIDLYLLAENTSAKNILGYYCYDTNNRPETEADLRNQIVIALPLASEIKNHGGNMTPGGRYGAMQRGEGVRLHYYKDGKDEGERFPAGVSVGFVVYNDGYRNAFDNKGGLNDGYGGFFSTAALNTGGKEQMTLFRLGDFVIFGFEDWDDMDYNDLVFHIASNPYDATTPDIPDVKPEEKPDDKVAMEVDYSGTLAFEDLWPSQGDFDMNDVVVKYSSTVGYNTKNEIVETKDNYTLLWSGAGYGVKNGFAYQLPVSSSDVEVTGATMRPYLLTATISLFDDASGELTVAGKDQTPQYNVKTIYKKRYGKDKYTLPPYNPFIFSAGKKEVHLTNYEPTSDLNTTLLGTKDDASEPSKNLYYVTYDKYQPENQMPFAIHIPGDNYVIQKVEGIRIDTYYPKFMSWVKSNGAKDTDWYLHPAK